MDMNAEPRLTLQLEARLSPQCSIPYHEVRQRIEYCLRFTNAQLTCFQDYTHAFLQSVSSAGSAVNDGAGCPLEGLMRHLELLWVAECSGEGRQVLSPHPWKSPTMPGVNNTAGLVSNSKQCFRAQEVDLSIHIYQLQDDGPVEEYDNVGSDGYGEGPALMAHHWTLPSQDLEGVWDTLVFDDRVDLRLLEYVYTTMLFSERMVNPNLITWNR
ncbi:Pachytene checkpoint protein 2 [Actinomortierella wolfii]|nr:Pachytene checkpoint protein 2 [Actinomortierella wolfii]